MRVESESHRSFKKSKKNEENRYHGPIARKTEEFAAIMERKGEKLFPSDLYDLELLFQLYDFDKSGSLSLDEFSEVVNDIMPSSYSHLAPKQIAEFMNMVNADDDPEISLEEFVLFFKEGNKVQEFSDALAKKQQKSSAQRSTLMCYFLSVFVCFAIFLLMYLRELEEGNKSAGGQGASGGEGAEGTHSIGQVGLIICSLGLVVGICFLFVVPIMSLRMKHGPAETAKNAFLSSGRMMARINRQDSDAIFDSQQDGTSGGESASRGRGASRPASRGDTKLNAGRATNTHFGRIEGNYEDVADRTAEQYGITPEYAGPNIQEYVAPGKKFTYRTRTVPEQRLSQVYEEDEDDYYGDTSMQSRPPPTALAIMEGNAPTGSRVPSRQSSRGGGRRSRSQGRPSSRPQTAPAGSDQYALALVAPNAGNQLARVSSADPGRRGRSSRPRGAPPWSDEKVQWDDIPGYSQVQAEFEMTTPAGRPITAESNREIYTPDLYKDARRVQQNVHGHATFNPMAMGKKLNLRTEQHVRQGRTLENSMKYR